MAQGKAASNGGKPAEKKDPVYTVAVIDTLKGTLSVVDPKVTAKTQEKAMDAVADRASEWRESGHGSENFRLVAWLANSTRAKNFRRKTMPVTESESVEVTDDFFEPAKSHPAPA